MGKFSDVLNKHRSEQEERHNRLGVPMPQDGTEPEVEAKAPGPPASPEPVPEQQAPASPPPVSATGKGNDGTAVDHGVKGPAARPTSPPVKRAPAQKVKKSSGVSAFVDSWDARCMAASTQFSAIAESLRRVRAKLIHPDEGDPARSVLITSAGQGEGKSFVSANLGVIMAQSVGRHALLVDTDLRRPTLSNLFGADNSKGLVDYLRDGRALSELLVPSGMPRLSLLPAGEPPVNPAELITSEKMATMVAELQSRYEDRLILFDSPPVSVASETQVLAQHVDKVVVVVRWGGEGREGINKMIEQLGREKVLGVVFNAFKPTLLDSKSREGDGYYNYYAQSY